MKWGMGIVGKMLIAPNQRVYMLVLTDYFTKWVKAEAFHQVRDTEVKTSFGKILFAGLESQTISSQTMDHNSLASGSKIFAPNRTSNSLCNT